MKSREFGTWPPRNAPGVNRQHLYDEYNRAFKKERPAQPKEYASSDIEEYYRVPEIKDVSGDPNEQCYEALSRISDRKKNTKASKRQLVLRQVVGILVGSIVIVTTYQAMAAQQQSPSDSPAIVEPDKENTDRQPGQEDNAQDALSPIWTWSEDNQTVVLELYDSDGSLVEEISTEVSVSEAPATCNQEGLRTYTATVEREENTYSDTKSEVLPPLGHVFDSGKATVLESGQSAMIFTCARCREEFTIATSYTEND